MNNAIQQSLSSVQLAIVDGIIQNLPEILDTFKSLMKMYSNEKLSNNMLQYKIVEMNIRKDNFMVLVQELTKLSTKQDVDEETKSMYKYMVKELFEIFKENSINSSDFSNYLVNLK